MKSRVLASLPLLVVIGTIGGSVFAAERTCSSDRMVVEGDTDVVARIREALEGRDDIDACARVKVTRRGGLVAVEVVLPDGRSTSRSVSRPEDALPTVEALLLLPRHPAPAPASELEAPPAPASTSTLAPEVEAPRVDVQVVHPGEHPPTSERPAPDRARAGPSSHVRIELSVMSGARIGDDQTSVGLGVLSFVDVDGWLAGFAGRADYFHEMAGGPPGAAFSLALLGGRRVRLRTVALDLYGGPGLALRGQNTSVVEGPSTGRIVEETGGGGVPRVLVGGRVNFRARSILRTFVGIDGDFGARGEGGGPRGEDHRLPLWTVGLALGATVGTL